MTIKPGVSIAGVTAEAAVGLVIIYSVYMQQGAALRVTSCGEGKHMPGSLHSRGRAWDLGLVGDDGEIAARLRNALGAEWDVVLESDHIHVEYDPKGGKK